VQTQCNESRIEIHGLGERVLTADFDGGNIVSDGGVPLIAEVDRMFHVLASITRLRNASRASLLKVSRLGLQWLWEDP